MAIQTYDELAEHIGHHIECVTYAGGENVAIECCECFIVLLDFDRPESGS